MTTLDSRQMDVATKAGESPGSPPGSERAAETGNRMFAFVDGLPTRQQEVVRLKFPGRPDLPGRSPR